MDTNDYESDQSEADSTELRFIELRAEPWPEDNRRVRAHVQINPFEKRPNIDLAILDQDGEEAAAVTIVEVLDPKFVITMHIRGEKEFGKFTLTGSLYYEEDQPLDRATYAFELLRPEQTGDQEKPAQ